MTEVILGRIVGGVRNRKNGYIFKIFTTDKELIQNIKDIIQLELEKHHITVHREDTGYHDEGGQD